MPTSKASSCSTVSGSGIAPPTEREHEERHDLGSGVGEDVLDELADVVIDLAARLDRDDDRREVVVGEHHRRCLPSDVGPGAAHRHADVGRAQRRRVVDAIAGHRHHVSLLRAAPRRSAAWSRARRARRSPRAHRRGCPRTSCSWVWSNAWALTTSGSFPPMPTWPAIAAAVSGWSPVISTIRMPARWQLAHSIDHLGTGRVAHRDQPEKAQLTLGVLAVRRPRAAGQRSARERQHAQSLAGEALDLPGHALPLGRREAEAAHHRLRARRRIAAAPTRGRPWCVASRGSRRCRGSTSACAARRSCTGECDGARGLRRRSERRESQRP